MTRRRHQQKSAIRNDGRQRRRKPTDFGTQFADVPYPVSMEPNLVVEFYSR